MNHITVNLKRTNHTLTLNIQQDPQTIVCYHSNCLDGFMAAYVLFRLHNSTDDVIYLPITYDNKLPFKPEEHQGADVVFVDFCPTEQQVLDLVRSMSLNSITIFDHHATRFEDANKIATELFQKPSGFTKVDIHFDLDKSGARLVYDKQNFPSASIFAKELITLVVLAERYDLWKHDGEPECDESYLAAYFSNCINKTLREKIKAANSMGYEDRLKACTQAFKEKAEILETIEFSDILIMGRGFIATDLNDIRQLPVERTSVMLSNRPDGLVETSIASGACPGRHVNMFSTVVKRQFNDCAVVLTHEERNVEGEVKSWKYSLRQGAVRLMDMHKLAKAIEPDGGGHPDAAGFVSSMSPGTVVFHIENVLQQSHLPDGELNQWMNRLATSRRTQEACDCAEKAL